MFLSAILTFRRVSLLKSSRYKKFHLILCRLIENTDFQIFEQRSHIATQNSNQNYTLKENYISFFVLISKSKTFGALAPYFFYSTYHSYFCITQMAEKGAIKAIEVLDTIKEGVADKNKPLIVLQFVFPFISLMLALYHQTTSAYTC